MTLARSWCVAVLGAAGLTGCLSPTEVTLEIGTDSCHDAGYRGTNITVVSTQTLANAAGVAPPPAAQTTACGADGGIGSLVVVPGPNGNGPFIVTVATGLGVSPDTCASPDASAGCIIEKRQLTLIDHQPIVLPIEMLGICAGVVCFDGGTCGPNGKCVSDFVETENLCSGGGPCMTAGLSPDAATMEASRAPVRDAGHDAGHDAGVGVDMDSGVHDSGHDAEDATVHDAEHEAAPHDAGHDATLEMKDGGEKDAGEDARKDVVALSEPCAKLDAAVIDGGCVEVLASGQSLPWGIAVHDGRPYWTTHCVNYMAPRCYDDGGVWSVVDGGVVEVAGHQSGPFAIVASDGGVFWTTYGHIVDGGADASICTGTVMRAALAGGAPTTIAGSTSASQPGTEPGLQCQPLGIALAGGEVIWVDNGKPTSATSGSVNHAPASGGGGVGVTASTQIVGSQMGPGGVAVLGNEVYWTNFGVYSETKPSGTVLRATLDGGGVTTVATAQDGITNVTVADASVFWNDQNYEEYGNNLDASIYTSAADGTGARLVASGLGYSWNVAVDAEYVYWADPGGGRIFRTPRVATSTTKPTVLVDHQDNPVNVAVEGQMLYWTNNGSCDAGQHCSPGSVMKLRLPVPAAGPH